MNPVIWIFGRPGSGKTTLSKALVENWPELSQFSQQPLLLDSDEVRAIYRNKDFTPEGRMNHIERLAHMAQIASNQMPVIVCAVTPFWEHRKLVKEMIGNVRLIHLNLSNAMAKERGKPMWEGSTFHHPTMDEAFCLSAEWPTTEQVKLISKIK